MTKSLLEVILSEERRVVFGVGLMIAALVVRSARKEDWTGFVWLPLFLISTFLSLPALVGCVGGGYGFFAVFAFWPFPIAAVLLWFAKPMRHAVEKRALIGLLATVLLALALFLVPTSVKKYVRNKPNQTPEPTTTAVTPRAP